MSNACTISSGRPTTSNVKSAPRPSVSARTASIGSSAAGSTAWVAPTFRDASRRVADRSIATMVDAPEMRAPWMTDWPTPPQPMTATLDPGVTPAVLNAAPNPVVTPQPSSASSSSTRSVAIGDDRRLVHDHRLGERAATAHRRGGPSVAESEALRREHRRTDLAVVRQVVAAPPARAARGRHRRQDAVADLGPADVGADGLDDAAALVSGHDRQRQVRLALDDRDVGVADPAGRQPDEHVVRSDRRRREVLDDEWLADLVGDGDLHRADRW